MELSSTLSNSEIPNLNSSPPTKLDVIGNFEFLDLQTSYREHSLFVISTDVQKFLVQEYDRHVLKARNYIWFCIMRAPE